MEQTVSSVRPLPDGWADRGQTDGLWGKIHDTWLKKIGFDVDKKLRAPAGAAGNVAPFNPSIDDPVVRYRRGVSGKGFGTGLVGTGGMYRQPPGGPARCEPSRRWLETCRCYAIRG
jgi:hypothetical protein